MTYNKYDIYLAKVAYEDNPTIFKNRPVMIVDDMQVYVLSIKITSHSPRANDPLDYQIINWKNAGLLKPSTLRIGKKIQLLPNNLIKRLGRLDQLDINNIQNLI